MNQSWSYPLPRPEHPRCHPIPVGRFVNLIRPSVHHRHWRASCRHSRAAPLVCIGLRVAVVARQNVAPQPVALSRPSGSQKHPARLVQRLKVSVLVIGQPDRRTWPQPTQQVNMPLSEARCVQSPGEAGPAEGSSQGRVMCL